MTQPAPAVRSLQRLRTATLLAGAVLAIASVVAVAVPVLGHRQAALEEATSRGVLLAQVLEADASRTVASVSVTLHALGDGLAASPRHPREAEAFWVAQMNHVLVGLPFLRSIAVLDARGQVLVSTNAEEVGLVVPMQRLDRLPAPGQDRLQALQPGRTLADLVHGGNVRPASVNMLPLLLRMPASLAGGKVSPTPHPSEPQAPAWVLALINPEALAQIQQQALPLSNSAVWLASRSGQLLAGLDTLPQMPGQSMASHPVFARLQAGADNGSYAGLGALPGDLLVSYRTSPRRGWVVAVEQSQEEVLGPWRAGLWGPVMTGVLALSLITASTIIVRRSLQARADALDALQQAHAQLAERERDLRVLLRSVQELIFRTDRDGRITFVNARWTTLHRGQVNDALGRRLSELAEAGDRAAIDALFQPAENGPRSVEATLRNGDGEPRRYLMAIVPLQRESGQDGYAGSAVDVTEHARAERLAREARDAAQEASRLKTEFLANIGHELRTPLQSILGFSELGMGRSRETARLQAMFEDIHASGQRMLAMVNNLLDVSKLESALGAFELAPADLRELVRDVAHELEPLRVNRYLELAQQMPQPLPVRVDPVRLQQTLRNLLANAIKFSPPGSTIEITGWVDAPSQDLHLCVADRGPGIPADELDRIFDPFVQSSATKDGSGGTGLGLAISRRIVDLHGGRLYAANRPGGGAEFHLVLPPPGAGHATIA
jgi:PAS domain S-box-containing protein